MSWRYVDGAAMSTAITTAVNTAVADVPTQANFDVAGTIDTGYLVAGGAIYSPLYEGLGGAGVTLLDDGGQNTRFWWDGSGWHVEVNGSDVCTWHGGLGKTFVIDHPADPERYLVHACLEGPEIAVFYRGQAQLDSRGRAQITLPGYFEALTRADSATVQVTPLLENADDPFGPVAATRVADGRFVICGPPHQRVCWRVEAQRADVEPLAVSPLRSAVSLQGSGPYRWLR